MRSIGCAAAAVMAVVVGGAVSAAAQVPAGRGAEPLPQGQRLTARDGDLIVIEGDARVRIVRQRHAIARTIYSETERWLVVLADYVPDGGRADGRVDATFNFSRLEGEWPIEERWEGAVVLEEYASVGPSMAPGGVGIVFPTGLVQLFSMGGPAPDLYRRAAATAVLRYSGGGRGSGPQQPFDQVERLQIAVARRNAAGGGTMTGPAGITTELNTFTSGISGGVVASSPQAGALGVAGGQAPVRVGGSIRPPVRISSVPPVYPEAARKAGITGVVILEITIDTEGAVSQARILRSPHEMLSQPAIDTVMQWRFEPTLLNGVPVPVVMTATVNFVP